MLWRVDTETQMMVCEEVWSSPQLHSAKFLARVRNSRQPLDVGLPGKVWNSGQPMWVDGYTDPFSLPGLFFGNVTTRGFLGFYLNAL